jgi:hypothetical protein
VRACNLKNETLAIRLGSCVLGKPSGAEKRLAASRILIGLAARKWAS